MIWGNAGFRGQQMGVVVEKFLRDNPRPASMVNSLNNNRRDSKMIFMNAKVNSMKNIRHRCTDLICVHL